MNKQKIFKILTPVLVLGGAVLVTILLISAKPEIEEEKNEFPELSVEVLPAQLSERAMTSHFQGAVRAKTNIELIAQVTGKVTSVSDKFIEGAQFDANEPLLTIDDSDYRVALRSAEAAVAEAQVQLEIEQASAATNAREWRDLQGRSIEEANPLRLNKPQVEGAKARLSAARAQLTVAKLDLDRTSISAPFAGRIQSKTAELGQFIPRGSSIGRVFATDAVEIRIPMSDLQITELGLTLGQSTDEKTRVKADVSAVFGAQQHHWDGYLKSVDASVDRETRLFYATVVVEDPFAKSAGQTFPLAPGLFVDVELRASSVLSGIQIPREALRNGSVVFVVKDGVLNLRNVQAIFTSADVALLKSGEDSTVKSGELVVVSSVPGAYEGMAVKTNDSGSDGSSSTPIAASAQAN